MKSLGKVYVAAMLLTMLASTGAAAIEMGDPNVSRDAAVCRDLTNDFKKTLAPHANDPSFEDAKKTGERGAYLCRFERYREGITRLQQALAKLRDAPTGR